MVGVIQLERKKIELVAWLNFYCHYSLTIISLKKLKKLMKIWEKRLNLYCHSPQLLVLGLA